MEQNKVPQDNIRTYNNNKKAMYATDGTGKYALVSSSGWKVEEEATMQAILELKRLAEKAHEEVRKEEKSPLYYHMYANRMDLQLLSESTGLFKWRIKRHFRPSVFLKLSSRLLVRYAHALGMTTEELHELPAENKIDVHNE